MNIDNIIKNSLNEKTNSISISDEASEKIFFTVTNNKIAKTNSNLLFNNKLKLVISITLAIAIIPSTIYFIYKNVCAYNTNPSQSHAPFNSYEYHNILSLSRNIHYANNYYFKQTTEIDSVLNLVDDILFDTKNISIPNYEITHKSFSNKFDDKNIPNKLKISIQYEGPIKTTFKTNNGDVTFEYDTIILPTSDNDDFKGTILFANISKIQLDGYSIKYNALKTSNLDKLKDVYNFATSDLNRIVKQYNSTAAKYDPIKNQKTFLSLQEKYIEKNKALNPNPIIDSGVSYRLNLYKPRAISRLKYLDKLTTDFKFQDESKQSEAWPDDLYLLQSIDLCDKTHGQYTLYSVMYDEKVFLAFIKYKNNYFSLNWRNITDITGMDSSQWEKAHGPIKDKASSDFILEEFKALDEPTQKQLPPI